MRALEFPRFWRHRSLHEVRLLNLGQGAHGHREMPDRQMVTMENEEKQQVQHLGALEDMLPPKNSREERLQPFRERRKLANERLAEIATRMRARGANRS